ncbi:TrmH family RNA methyltransferase [Staphylococcus agnetis]|uniref:TrmH family RNA methyltransferase n=1 Tax=Staphylococcus agnetis TaxID=985762 RepID=UPI0004E3B28D|nr:RNA methyltransferase [Staphylococcus agnetis]KFE41905.1 RNA methyltransferase [Staphylococcus agnetis]NJH65992.1 RNA methyltransferase [Staphylococcus agnetis]NJH66533.1 RNA methyltransferase [Staphylococcus agnetis]NJH98334.1 RNA methyltransferase [Staphylococcus agnetis]PTH49130.1 RNA methyltransferase [Staphylococcus agnetis]
MEQITSNQNAKVKLFQKLKKKRERDKQGLAVLEGYHLVEEAIQNNIKIEHLFVLDVQRVDETIIHASTHVYEINMKVAETLAGTVTPQGIFAIIKKPESQIKDARQVLILDRVQDPGNVGTLIRTADAAGLDAVILSKGTADVYSDKVLRASQGSVFHIPVMVVDDVVTFIHQFNGPVYGTALVDAVSYHSLEKQQNTFALVLGNEGEGISDEILKDTTQNVTIPIYGRAESLNVAIAAGILMFHLKG